MRFHFDVSYVGQTGRYVSVRAREHGLTIINKENAHLPAHVRHCMCVPDFRAIRVLGRSHDSTARELLEAFYISARGDACVSQSSVSLLHGEKRFLRGLL